MEYLSFPYWLGGMMSRLPLRIDGKLVSTAPIALLAGARKKVASFVDLPTLDRWLAVLPPTEISRQLQDNLCEFLKTNSSSIQVQEAAETAQKQKERGKVIIIGEALGSADHFRKDASLGAARLPPALIDVAAKSGCVDLFVRAPAMWGGEAPMRRMMIDLSGYRPRFLQAMRRGNPEVLAGPQMLERYPDSPLVERRLIPARVSVENGRVVTVPEHLQRFPWEL
jgi:hypothetical protein